MSKVLYHAQSCPCFGHTDSILVYGNEEFTKCSVLNFEDEVLVSYVSLQIWDSETHDNFLKRVKHFVLDLYGACDIILDNNFVFVNSIFNE